MSSSDPAAHRNLKIARFKQELHLKSQLEVGSPLSEYPSAFSPSRILNFVSNHRISPKTHPRSKTTTTLYVTSTSPSSSCKPIKPSTLSTLLHKSCKFSPWHPHHHTPGHPTLNPTSTHVSGTPRAATATRTA